MKAIMYHYVRPDDPSMPHLRYLHLDDFRRQLDWFDAEYGFIARAEFERSLATGEPVPGVLLTFDDGLKDHHRHVLPELQARGLWGLFYVSTAPLNGTAFIDVHRTHLLLGRYGGTAVAEVLRGMVDESMLSHAHVDEFSALTYQRQSNSADTNYVKRLLNYYIDYAHRTRVVDQLFAHFGLDSATEARDYYLNADELRDLHQAGMVVGSHTVHHPVMSKLSVERQEWEITTSFAALEQHLPISDYRSFCHPYGGFHSFNDDTERLLDRHSSRFAFNVEPRAIAASDLQHRKQALPRFDCNAFPFGQCRVLDV